MRIGKVMAVAAVAGVCAVSQCVGAAGTDEGGARALRVSLRTTKDTYVSLEPVIITARIENPTSASIEGFRSLSPGSGDLRLYIKDDRGEEEPFVPAVQETVLGGRSELKAGELVDGDVLIMRNYFKGQAAFPGPGTFRVGGQVRMVADGERVVLKAEEIPVVVVEPSVDDRAFLERVGGSEAWMRLHSRSAAVWCKGKPQDACLDGLRGIIRDNSRSAYAPFLEYDLAMSIESGELDLPHGPDETRNLLADFLRRWPGHGLRPRVLASYALALGRDGKDSSSRGILDNMEREYPGRAREIRAVRDRIVREAGRK